MDFAKYGMEESVYYLLAYVWVVLSLWNDYFRSRCPKCKSTQISLVSREELKRWDKEVQERQEVGSPDKPEYIYVDVIITMVKMRFSFECKSCKHIWYKDNDIPEN